MIIITGAAGFIGSCIVAGLNERSVTDLLLVDHFDGDDDPKRANLANKKYTELLDKEEFLAQIIGDKVSQEVTAFIHMGACSSTTLDDAEYFQKNNLEYTQHCAQWALKHNVRFIYASSAATYGDGSVGYSDDDETTQKCKPLNLYGDSKQRFDLWALKEGALSKMVGLKFFNVFGPNEYHKGDMKSVVAKSYKKVATEGVISLFKSYKDEYADGEQKRDFIYVKDTVSIVLFFLDHPEINGIFNVGTGKAHSWNELADAIFAAAGKELNIEYMEMPESLRPKYQYFTEAKMGKLKSAGYDKPFYTLKDAVADYAGYLKTNSIW